MNSFTRTPSLAEPLHPLTEQAASLAQRGLLVIQAAPGFGKSLLLDAIAVSQQAMRASRHGGWQARPGWLHLIDDVERADLPDLLGQISDCLSRGGACMVATRDAAVAAELRLRFVGRCEAFGPADLRLDEAGVGQLLDMKPGSSELAEAMTVTGGWPLAVRLLQNDRQRLSSRAAAAERLLACLVEYFNRFEGILFDAAEIARLAEVLELGELTPALLGALFPAGGIVETLRGLSRRGAFVVEEIGQPSRFVIEPVFARYVAWRSGAQTSTEGLEARSLALAQMGRVRPALQLAVQSRHPQIIADVICVLGGLRVPLTLGCDARYYFQQIDIEACRQRPDILIGRVFTALQQGQIAYARDLYSILSQADLGSATARMHRELLDFAIRLYENQTIWPETLDAFEARHLDGLCDDMVARAILQQVRASCLYHLGDHAGAHAAACYVMEMSSGVDAPLLRHYAKFYVALSEMRTGHFSRANALLEEAARRSEQELGVGNPQAAQAWLLSARVHLERLDYDRAEEILQEHAGAGEIHANWRDASELVVFTVSALLARSAGLNDVLAALDARHHAYMASAMASCARMVSLLKTQLLFEAGRDGEASEELDRLPADPACDGGARPTAQDRQAALLRMRLAGDISPRDPAFTALWEAIETSGDIFLRLRARLARYESLARVGHEDASSALLAVIRLASRHGAYATLACEWPRIASWAEADVRGLQLSSEEQNCLDRIRKPPPRPPEILSPRERQVLLFLADGLSSKEMARNLNISIGTVKGYRRKLYEKLNVFCRSSAVLAARTLYAVPSQIAGSHVFSVSSPPGPRQLPAV